MFIIGSWRTRHRLCLVQVSYIAKSSWPTLLQLRDLSSMYCWPPHVATLTSFLPSARSRLAAITCKQTWATDCCVYMGASSTECESSLSVVVPVLMPINQSLYWSRCTYCIQKLSRYDPFTASSTFYSLIYDFLCYQKWRWFIVLLSAAKASSGSSVIFVTVEDINTFI